MFAHISRLAAGGGGAFRFSAVRGAMAAFFPSNGYDGRSSHCEMVLDWKKNGEVRCVDKNGATVWVRDFAEDFEEEDFECRALIGASRESVLMFNAARTRYIEIAMADGKVLKTKKLDKVDEGDESENGVACLIDRSTGERVQMPTMDFSMPDEDIPPPDHPTVFYCGTGPLTRAAVTRDVMDEDV